MKELEKFMKLASKVTVYVPATMDVNKETDNTEQVEQTAKVLSECFGGATVTPAVGYYVSNTGELVTEKTTVVFAYADTDALNKNVVRVIQRCVDIKREMKQESVGLEINGEMYFI
jgi:hypothetical protein